MTEVEISLRGVLFTLALVAVLASGPFVIALWPQRTWPVRVVLVGLAVLLIYILASQVKALSLDIPFDLFSWIGLVGITILDTGLLLALREQHRRHEQG